MNTTQLKYFIALSRCLNFSDVAKQFYISQPTISHHIKTLESEIGISLFHRDKHNVSLTNSGKAFLRYAERILELSDIAEVHMRGAEEGTEGVLRISTVSSMAKQMTEHLEVFSSKYPNIITEIECVNGIHQIESITSKMSDVYFSFDSLLRNTSKLDLIPLLQDQLCIFIHKRYTEFVDPSNFSKLNHIPMLMYALTSAPYLTGKVLSLCEEYKFYPSKTTQYTSFLSIIIAINAGLGFGIVPSQAVSFLPESCISIPIPGANSIIDNAVGYFSNTNNRAAKNFIDVIKENLSIARIK